MASRAKKTDAAPKAKAEKKVAAPKTEKKVAAPKAEKAPKVVKEKVERAPAAGKNVVDTSRYAYAVNDTPTASGRKSRDTGDEVAAALRGKTLEEVFEIMTANSIEIKDEWRTKNPGMARMAMGNVLRGKFRREGKIKVAGKWVKNPEAVAEAA